MYQRDFNNCPKAGIKIRQSDNDYKEELDIDEKLSSLKLISKL